MRVESLHSRAISVFIALLLIAGPCLAQATQPSLEVVVKDPTGSPIEPHLLPNSGHMGGTLGAAANRHAGYGG